MSTRVPRNDSSNFLDYSSQLQYNTGADKSKLYSYLSQGPIKGSFPHAGHVKRQSITSNPQVYNNDTRGGNLVDNNNQSAPYNSASSAEWYNTGLLTSSDQSDDYSTHVELSEFNLDQLLTPEYSENHLSEHTTPQELIWEQQFYPQDTAQPRIANESQQTPLHGHHDIPSPSDILRDLIPPSTEPPNLKFVTSSQLISPRLTSTTSPEPILTDITLSRGNSSPAVANMSRDQKRDAEPLQVATNQNTLSPQTTRGTQPGASPIMRAVSPIVIVSSHTRGDSPARNTFARARSSSKRSRDGDFQYSQSPKGGSSPLLGPTPIVSNDNTSRLMPPDMFSSEEPLEETSGRSGLGPSQRNDQVVASANELEELRRIDSKNADVETWLATSETGSVAGDEAAQQDNRRAFSKSNRPRARSTGVPVDSLGLPMFSDRSIPGPGVLIDERSEDDYSDNDAESTASSQIVESPPVLEEKLNGPTLPQDYFGVSEADTAANEEEDPLPRQFIRRTPWQDPFKGGIIEDVQGHPVSSNAAMTRWNQEAAKWDNASRAATWGTRRRLSDSEVSSIVEGSRVRHPSLVKPGRTSSILTKARKIIPRRSSSKLKKIAEATAVEKSPERPAQQHRSSVSSIRPLQRISSFGKAKSPPLDTGSAIMAMAGHLAAVGQSTAQTTNVKPEPELIKSPLQIFRKNRSKSDAGRGADKSAPSLTTLVPGQQDLSAVTFPSPMQEQHMLPLHQHSSNDMLGDDDDEDDNDLVDDAGIKMDFTAHADSIIPTYEGFKIHARQLNPRLEPYLIDRIGQEQVRRYKKLVENKIKHTRAVLVAKKCPSAAFCSDLGGKPKLLVPRASARDPETTCAQFQVTSATDENMEVPNFTEGVVTPALFPAGIPLPPVPRLPAEFECPLCFKVKKFQKPSDWTKHVHEDVQPFSCTFPNCGEPKSFKRKADWVRHENERHRRLESWKCSVQDCIHECFRKDNFVQHLVREHKMVEPKVKTRGSGSSKAKPAQGNPWDINSRDQEDREFWRLVESCRNETMTRPQDEPCRFCGNVLNSWKKLSVHMGKHMEYIAMPVLELVETKEVKPDTIVSPIEQNYPQSYPQPSAITIATAVTDSNLSPYAVSAQSTFQHSSTGHSPAIGYAQVHANTSPYSQNLYGVHNGTTTFDEHNIQQGLFESNDMYTSFDTFAPHNASMAGHITPTLQTQGPVPMVHTGYAHHQQFSTPVARSAPLNDDYTTNSMSNPTYRSSQHAMLYSSSTEASRFTHYTSPMQGHHHQQYQQHNMEGTMEQIQRLDLSQQAHDYIYDGQHPAYTNGNYHYSG